MRIDRVKLISEMARQDVTVKALAEKALVSRMTVSAMRCGKVSTTTALGTLPALWAWTWQTC